VPYLRCSLVRQVAEPLGPARNYIAGPFAIRNRCAQSTNTPTLRTAGFEDSASTELAEVLSDVASA
jgi:hypothetical protein